MNMISFFAGCGGLDLGFEQAGVRVVWANEFEPSIHATYEPKSSLGRKRYLFYYFLLPFVFYKAPRACF